MTIMQNKIQDVSALTRTYDLLLWIIPLLEKFPRSQRFLLGERIESTFLDIMELLIQATYSKNKANILKQANLKLETSRYLIRLSKDLRYLGIEKYEYISKSLNEIGTEVGGWLKYSRSHQKR